MIFGITIVPGMGIYMRNKLKVNAYPMHLLVNREGKIVKVANSMEDMIPSLEKEIGKLHY
jgi:hypothetical protein